MTTQTPLVTGTDFITVATRDYDAAAEFYGNVLGPFGVEFRPNNHPIALHVDDVAAARTELESRGVQFKGDILDSGVCHQAFFEDPDGNVLGLHHRYAPPEARPGSQAGA